MPQSDSKQQKKDKKEKSSTSKQLVPKPKSSTKPKTPKKQGGALVNDVKNLAVPFAILLAKEGLSKYFDESKATKDTKKHHQVKHLLQVNQVLHLVVER